MGLEKKEIEIFFNHYKERFGKFHTYFLDKHGYCHCESCKKVKKWLEEQNLDVQSFVKNQIKTLAADKKPSKNDFEIFRKHFKERFGKFHQFYLDKNGICHCENCIRVKEWLKKQNKNPYWFGLEISKK